MGRTKATATLRGGPADGTEVEVDVIAGCLPRYLGVDGGNYVPDWLARTWGATEYLHWEADAPEPPEPTYT